MRAARTSMAVIFLAAAALLSHLATAADTPATQPAPQIKMSEAKAREWLAQWQTYITNDARKERYCDKENAEELAWLMGPFMDGFYFGYRATHDPQWIDLLVDWSDSWLKRAVKEPDGYLGWPKTHAAGTDKDDLNSYNADSLLGEAVVLRPIVLMSHEILRTPALKQKYGAKAESYLKLAEQIYEKWDHRGVWRPTKDGGMITVVLPFGIDPKTNQFTENYAHRNDPKIGFSHPNNKANLVARWLLAMSDATGKPVYKERAEKWFRLLKSRMKENPNGAFDVWNYWQPAGPWDYLPNGQPKHWVGIHPNDGYYSIDTTAITDAYTHGLVFTKEDITRLTKTALADPKRNWPALAPFNADLQKSFESNFKPGSWGGLGLTPWYLSLQTPKK